MKNLKINFSYLCVVAFSVFVGAQLTEAILLVPHWQSLSANEFYSYYERFGPGIGQFYTILTIVSVLIPIGLTIFCLKKEKSVFILALISAIFAILVVLCFYIYFKDVNQLFYQRAFSQEDLMQELVNWSHWHWGRIILELLSLIFLVITLTKLNIRGIKSPE